MGVTGLISEKTEVLYAELNERVEAATGSHSVTGDSLWYIYYYEKVRRTMRTAIVSNLNYQNTYCHQTFQGGEIMRGALTHKYI